jgi:hypothetical protein
MSFDFKGRLFCPSFIEKLGKVKYFTNSFQRTLVKPNLYHKIIFNIKYNMILMQISSEFILFITCLNLFYVLNMQIMNSI